MNRGLKVSRLAWALLAFSALPCGAVWLVSHRVRPIRWAGDAELVALTTERERLHESDDATRDAWRDALVAHFAAHRGELSEDGRDLPGWEPAVDQPDGYGPAEEGAAGAAPAGDVGAAPAADADAARTVDGFPGA